MGSAGAATDAVGDAWHHRRMNAPAPPVMLISGDEELLVDRAIASALARARQAEPEVERRDGDGTTLTAAGFEELVAPSLFAEPRIVIVRNVQNAGKELVAAITGYLSDPVDGVTLVIHHSGAAKNRPLAQAIRTSKAPEAMCAKITRAGERIDFVRAEIRAAGGKCDTAAATALVDAIGSDLRELSSAARQLASDTGGAVTEAAVGQYHSGRAEVSGFAVSDKAVAGDLAGALEALRWASAVGVADVLVADALADGVRSIAKVASAGPGSAQTLAGQLGMPPWKVDKCRQAARGWTARGLATAMGETAALNGDVKGQAADNGYALERAVCAIVAARKLRD